MNIIKIRKENEKKNEMQDLKDEREDLIKNLKPYNQYYIIGDIKHFDNEKTRKYIESLNDDDILRDYRRVQELNKKINNLKDIT